MKKIFIFVIFILFVLRLYGQSSNVTYIPNPAAPTAPTSPYPIGDIPDWYKNLEKYWFYRYRLVNDYMILGDFAGGSIPAQQRVQGDIPGSSNIPNLLKWADAPIDLGHYLAALACEWQLLNNNNYSTERTNTELQFALNAFDRLDDNAEQYCYNVSGHSPTGYPGMIVPYANFTYGFSHNGFFIRDDVPWSTITNPSFTTCAGCTLTYYTGPPAAFHAHFNRPGLTSNQQVINGDASFKGRFQGFAPGEGTAYSNPNPWTSPHSNAQYPCEESQDDYIELFLGLALVQKYVVHPPSHPLLQNQAADAMFRSMSWIFSTLPYGLIINPVSNTCVFGEDAINSCEEGGAYFFVNTTPGSRACHIVADPFGHSSAWMETASEINEPVFQALQYVPWAPCFDTHGEGSNIYFADVLASIAKDWYPPAIPPPFSLLFNSTWPTLKYHTESNNWGAPQLPLIYGLWWGWPHPDANYRQSQYENELNIAPPCDPYNFEAVTPGDYANTDWNGNDRLAEPGHRQGVSCYPDLGFDAEFNGLDYMELFSLYALKRNDYLHGMMNSYYMENFNINYPDGSGYGSTTIPLTLNFLEYVSFVNTFNSDSKVTIRCAKQIILSPGTISTSKCSSCYTLLYPQDYTCAETPYNFASILCSGCRMAPGDGDTSIPVVYLPTGLGYIPPENQAVSDGDEYNDSLLTPEIRRHILDSLIRNIITSGNETNINSLRYLGINIDSIIQHSIILTGDTISKEIIVSIYPNPTNGKAYLEYSIPDIATVDVHITTTLGQDIRNIIDDYDHNPAAGTHKININSDALVPGLYYVSISINNQIITKKLSVM